jgi:hypothetical protein
MRQVLVAGVLVLLIACSGCGRDSYSSLRKQQAETAREAVDVLASIKDAESAKEARPKLQRLGNRWRDLEKRMEALPAPSAAETEAAKPAEDEMTGIGLRYIGQSVRVAFVPGGKEALAELAEIKMKKR